MFHEEMIEKLCPFDKNNCVGEECAVAILMSVLVTFNRSNKTTSTKQSYRCGLINSPFSSDNPEPTICEVIK